MIPSMWTRLLGLSMRQPLRECLAMAPAARCASPGDGGSTMRLSMMASYSTADAGIIRASFCGKTLTVVPSRSSSAATGNLKATQKLLGHASLQTTGDIYAEWDVDQLVQTMAAVLMEDDE